MLARKIDGKNTAPRYKKRPESQHYLDVKEYEKLLEDLEELDCIGPTMLAKASGETPIPY